MNLTDNETGEPMNMPRKFLRSIPTDTYDIDMETGEADTNKHTLFMKKTTFVVPKKLIQPQEEMPTCCIDKLDNYTLFKKEQVMSLKQDIILGSNKLSHRLFLLPTFFFYFRLAAALIFIIEVVLHTWAHKKNAQNKDAHIYYRSPFHVVSSQFCALCQNKFSMAQVSKLQVEREKHSRHLKDMAKTMY